MVDNTTPEAVIDMLLENLIDRFTTSFPEWNDKAVLNYICNKSKV